MDAPDISVVIPVHNGAVHLGEALASVQIQTLAPIEVVVVDDGSSDGGGDVARAAGATVLRRPHAGAAAARNTGVAHCRGQFVAFLDADDRMTSDRLAVQAGRLTENPDLHGVLGHIRTFGVPSHGAVATPVDRARTADPTGSVVPGWLPSTLLVRRTVFDSAGSFEESLLAGEFVDWMARCRQSGLRFAMLDLVVAERRVHADNTTRDSERVRQGYTEVARRAIARHKAPGSRR